MSAVDKTANMDDSKVELVDLQGSINGDPEKATSEKAANEGLDVGDQENADQMTNFDAEKEEENKIMPDYMEDDLGESVRALTLKDDIDYEDPRQMHDLGEVEATV